MIRPPLLLAYHGLGRFSREHDPHNLMVAPEDFGAQVRALQRRGYAFATVSDFAARIRDGRPPAGLCALSFDDGSADNADVLPRLLSELGVPATVFVCPGLLGVPHPFMPAEAGVRLMTADEIRALGATGRVELGSHTNEHTVLADAGPEDALREMRDSKAALEDLVGATVRSFAYPECGYSPACPDAARRAGYASAVTCGPRGSWRPYELQRISLDSLDNRLTWALKSRDLYRRLWSSPPGRAARAVARPLRHPG